jgi:hypothetical protein
MIWGLNLGYDDAQNAVNLAQSIMRAFSEDGEVVKNGVVLDYLELGESLFSFGEFTRSHDHSWWQAMSLICTSP